MSETYTVLPIEGGGVFPVTVEYVEKLKSDYGEYVNVDIEIKKMRTWLESNPTRRKTKRGMPRFMTSWILRSVGDVQNRDRARAQRTSSGYGRREPDIKKDSFDVNEFFELALANSYRKSELITNN